MRKHFSIGVFSALAAALCVAQSAHAGIVGFDDIAFPGTYQSFSNNLYDGGLHFKEDQFAIMPGGFFPHPSGQSSKFMEAGNYSEVEPITLSAYTGAIAPNGDTDDIAFNLWYLKIGLGDGNLGAADLVTIRGTSAAGCVGVLCDPTMQVLVTPHFQLISLENFTNLISVTIDQQVVTDQSIVSNPHLPGDPPLVSGPDGLIDSGWLGFDDFSYTAFDPNGDNPPGEKPPPVPATNVPEPGAWALMIVGFGGIGAVLRRHRRLALAAA